MAFAFRPDGPGPPEESRQRARARPAGLARLGRARRPALDELEGRALPSAGRVPLSFLETPITEGTPLAEHIHPHLTILINGVPQAVPAGIGIGQAGGGNLPLHTHDDSGTIHVESTRALPFRLQDFFTIWGQSFNSHDVLGHTADVTHKITMTVDGRPSRAFGSLLLQDRQDIVIRYDTVTAPARRRGR
jgi:hypothetical protein